MKRIFTFVALIVLIASFGFAQDAAVQTSAVVTVQAGHNSMTAASVHFKNVVTITARHKDGTIFAQRIVPNLVTNAGFTAIEKAISDTATQPAAANYIALANDTSNGNVGTVAVTDTALNSSGTGSTEITDHGLARAQGTFTADSPGSKQYTVSKVFTSTTGTISCNKVGLFNASSGTTMYYEALFTQVTLNGANGDTLTVTWTSTLS
jgi:hypothetical protein